MPESAPSSPGPSDGESVEIDLRDEDLVDMPTAPMPTIEIEAALPPARRSPTSRPAPPPAQDPPSAADLIAGLVRDTRLIPAPQQAAPPQTAPPQAEPLTPPPPPTASPQTGPPQAEPLTPPPPPQQQSAAQAAYPPMPAAAPPPQYPPPPPQYPPAPAVEVQAKPYPEPGAERSPLILIGAGVGLGLLLLVLGLLGMNLLGGQDDPQTAQVPTGTPSAVSAGTISATASSTQDPEGGITYSAENTIDGRPETAWNSDGRADGKGPGMVLTYRFADPVDLTTVTVLNGYQKTTQSAGKPAVDLFTQNGRVHTVRVTTDTGSWTWDLADDKAPQTLTKAFGRTSSVRLEVVSVYPGTKYLDLAVSEVSFGALG